MKLRRKLIICKNNVKPNLISKKRPKKNDKRKKDLKMKGKIRKNKKLL